MNVLFKLFPKIFSYTHPDSYVNKIRAKRMNLFWDLVKKETSLGPDVRVLDVGGTTLLWSVPDLPNNGMRFEITLLNLDHSNINISIPNVHFNSVIGRAEELQFDSKEFDIVFSNSVIEHVGSKDNQQKMANEVHRVGHRYFIQTPSQWFPLEPHSRIPLFQFLPRSIRAFLIFHFNINYFPAGKTYESCLDVSDSTMMVTQKQYRNLFSEANIIIEYLAGIPKSYIATHGWETEAETPTQTFS